MDCTLPAHGCIDFFRNAISTFEQIISEESARMGIAPNEARVLMFIAANPHTDTAAELAGNHCVSKAFMSKTIDSLQSKKLISLSRDEKDKRIQHIRLEKKSEQYTGKLISVFDKFAAELLEGTTDAERKNTFILFEKMSQNIEKMKQRKEKSDE